MKIVRELIDYSADISVNECRMFTANNTIKNNGELVMGAGNALAIKLAVPDLASLMGELVSNEPDKRIHVCPCGDGAIASFQTKEHWRNPTPVHVLEESITALHKLALDNVEWTFHLPMPAVNHGGMDVELVECMLEQLPDNVLIYLK